jgi:hypothetical protein
MTTGNLTKSRHAAARAVLALVSAGALAAVGAAVTSAQTGKTTRGAFAARVVSTTLGRAPRSWSYTWPLKPFDRQHPIRAFLDDPRIGTRGGRAFHFGIDISAPDGTAVYAVEPGTVYLGSQQAVAVLAPDRTHCFGYWHIVPVVESHQAVRRHQLLGFVGKGWEHVHFAERRGSVYVNPLRDGGLGPYLDRTPPEVVRVSVVGSDLVAVAFDRPDPRVPGGWADEPVTPALLRWRVAGGCWHTAADFRTAMLPRATFTRVYTPATRQNHKSRPGVFSFYLARAWNGGAPRNGVTTIEVAASDTAGNCTVVSATVPVTR